MMFAEVGFIEIIGTFTQCSFYYLHLYHFMIMGWFSTFKTSFLIYVSRNPPSGVEFGCLMCSWYMVFS